MDSASKVSLSPVAWIVFWPHPDEPGKYAGKPFVGADEACDAGIAFEQAKREHGADNCHMNTIMPEQFCTIWSPKGKELSNRSVFGMDKDGQGNFCAVMLSKDTAHVFRHGERCLLELDGKAAGFADACINGLLPEGIILFEIVGTLSERRAD